MAAELPARVDVVVVGSGAAALTGAVTAAQAGLRTILVEMTGRWGGTSTYSAGGVWIPNNPLMRELGVEDSEEAALAYIDACVGDIGPFTSAARKRAFVQQGPRMVEFLRQLGLPWTPGGLPDYYPHQPGFRPERSLVSAALDGRALGPLLATMREPPNFPPLVFTGKDVPALVAPLRKWSHLATLARIFAATLGWKALGKVPLSMGRATTGHLMRIAQKLGVPIFLETGMSGLEIQDGRVAAIEVTQQGRKRRIEARAVLIAAGGFARNEAYRRRHQPVGADYSAAAPGDTGGPIQIAERAGAATALMDEAWWMPVVLLPDGNRGILVSERAMPHSLMVDQAGQRFMNEAQPYNDAGRALIERNQVAPSIPSWLIIDARHRKHYAFATYPPRHTPRPLLDSGFFIKADSIDELAGKCGIDRPALRATIDRFNGFARSGDDPDFGRGRNAYDRVFGDGTVSPNPNLGTIEEAPFYAVRVYPGDLGTKGGLLTDEHGQVVDREGRPIAGLYAAGNSTASMMGRSYPGAGATLGPAMVFAYVAMRHARIVKPGETVL